MLFLGLLVVVAVVLLFGGLRLKRIWIASFRGGDVYLNPSLKELSMWSKKVCRLLKLGYCFISRIKAAI